MLSHKGFLLYRVFFYLCRLCGSTPPSCRTSMHRLKCYRHHSLVAQPCITLSVKHHSHAPPYVLSTILLWLSSKSYILNLSLTALLELNHEFWGSTASSLILWEIVAKSLKIHQFPFFFFLVPHSLIIRYKELLTYKYDQLKHDKCQIYMEILHILDTYQWTNPKMSGGFTT